MEEFKKIIFTIEQIKENRIDLVKQDVTKFESQLKKMDGLSIKELLYLHYAVALFYTKQNNYSLASHHFQQAVKYRGQDRQTKQLWLQAHLDFVQLDEQFKQYAQARMTLAKVLQYMEKNHQHVVDIARIYQKIGWLFFQEEELHQAHMQLEEAKKLFLQFYRLPDPNVMKVNDQLAEVYLALEQPELAEQLFENVIRKHKEDLTKVGEATLLLKLGELNFHTDLKTARKNISAAKNLVSEDHPLYLRAYMLLAEIEENIKAFPRAIKYYRKALNIVLKAYPKDHFLIVFIYSKLGTISLKIGEKEQAQTFLESGLPLASQHPKIRMQFLYALGKLYSGQKEYTKAFDMYTDFLQGLETEDKTRTLAYANTLQAIAYNYLAQDQFGDALVRYAEALRIYDKLGSNCREERGLSAIRLAYCYQTTGDNKEAEKYYLQGIQLLEKVNNIGLKEEAYLAIIAFYQETKQPKQRRLYENRLVNLQKIMNK
ncbi:tetratricopeptide repeat protein [Gracilibacillus massiliensis]|uniref:tetratricopeptide repeat protein n=1 Tax=Gracilibacillus massiliensis TaxID=1564956 RepID=UPI00071D55D1|nr:tetratricopeptide repeat protein [Gracilibacillus massiliensis]